jgi:topoisomerase IA-like protein
MEVKGIDVKKIVDPVLIGMHNGNLVHLCHGQYGPYLKYDGKNYSIPDWAKQENLDEMFNLYHAVKIIDYKMKKQKEAVASKIETKVNTFQNYKHAFDSDDCENDGYE